MKYVDMILRGHLPRYGGRVNEDAKKLLINLMARGTEVSQSSLLHACRHLHLAFKGYDSAEIYNVLATVLLKVISRYDPFYCAAAEKLSKSFAAACASS
jgi:hypothetical protein